MTATVHLDDPTTVESIDVVIGVDADPSGATPQFALVDAGGSLSGATWEDGSWVSEWTNGLGGRGPVRRQITARTPTIGDGGTLATDGSGSYDLWWRVTLVDETPVRHVAVIVVR